MYKNGDVDNYKCGDCVNFHKCKRIDHNVVKFAVPWFRCYDQHQFSGCICSDFEPSEANVCARANWKGFDKEWDAYVDQWIPYKNTDKNVYFTLNGDTSVRYGVKLLDFVFGNMFDGDTLKAVEKTYYKKSRSSPIGYALVQEDIKGVNLKVEV